MIPENANTEFFKYAKIYLAGFPSTSQDALVPIAYFEAVRSLISPDDVPELFQRAMTHVYTERDGRRTYKPATAPDLRDIAEVIVGARKRAAADYERRALPARSHVTRADMLRGKPADMSEDAWLKNYAVTPPESGLTAGDLTYGRGRYDKWRLFAENNPSSSQRETAVASMAALGAPEVASEAAAREIDVQAKPDAGARAERRSKGLRAVGIGALVDQAWKDGLAGYLQAHNHGPAKECPPRCPRAATKQRKEESS